MAIEIPPEDTPHVGDGVEPPRRRRGVSPLTRKILAVNLLAPVLLVVGALYLDTYQQGLLRSELESLREQGEMIASALAESSVSYDTLNGGTTVPFEVMAGDDVRGYHLLPEQARHMVRRMSAHSGRRVRLFDASGQLLADSRYLFVSGGVVEVSPLPPPRLYPAADQLLRKFNDTVIRTLGRFVSSSVDLPPYQEAPIDPLAAYEELSVALRFGETAEALRQGEQADVLSVAVPVQYYKQVVGAVLIDDVTDSVDANVFQVRKAILRLFLVTLGVTILLSWYQAGTIAHPVRRLARAAALVQSGRGGRRSIPDLSRRDDEIGDLSVALGGMTDALWNRIEATERFAADVAHEIKNPLTSMRSAVETAMRIDDPEGRRRLLSIVAEDVQRLNRLITDIADMSRVDVELMKVALPLDLRAMLSALSELESLSSGDEGPRIVLELPDDEDLWVQGSEGRMVQVLRNIIRNAVSFSPPQGTITLRAFAGVGAFDGRVVVEIDDEGPGIPDGKELTIFERFYTERPQGEQFGKHSGLGLAISKQIVEGMGGRISAVNRRYVDGSDVPGARFILTFPRLTGGIEH